MVSSKSLSLKFLTFGLLVFSCGATLQTPSCICLCVCVCVCVSRIFTMISLVEAWLSNSQLVKALPIGTSAPTVRSYTLSYTVLASGARVGARVEVKKNDLGKVSRIFFSRYQIGLRPGFRQWFTQIFLAWLTSATLRFFSLAEQCYTMIF